MSMPDQGRAGFVIIEGVRYCSAFGGIIDWEEGEPMGCHWCSPESFDASKHSEVGMLDV